MDFFSSPLKMPHSKEEEKEKEKTRFLLSCESLKTILQSHPALGDALQQSVDKCLEIFNGTEFPSLQKDHAFCQFVQHNEQIYLNIDLESCLTNHPVIEDSLGSLFWTCQSQPEQKQEIETCLEDCVQNLDVSTLFETTEFQEKYPLLIDVLPSLFEQIVGYPCMELTLPICSFYNNMLVLKFKDLVRLYEGYRADIEPTRETFEHAFVRILTAQCLSLYPESKKLSQKEIQDTCQTMLRLLTCYESPLFSNQEQEQEDLSDEE